MSDGAFAVCGDYYGDFIPSDLVSTDYTPVIALMDTTGYVEHYWKGHWSEQERCMGLSYNPETARLAVMVQGKQSGRD